MWRYVAALLCAVLFVCALLVLHYFHGGGRSGPGREVADLSALDPAFRGCLDELLSELRTAGFRPIVIATWRDQTRQAYYRTAGASQTLHSKHSLTGPGGVPAARAADVARDLPPWLIPWQASFYRALRAAAPRHGLVTGGTWARSRWLWALYDLGWDPGHIEAQPGRCRLPRPIPQNEQARSSSTSR